MLSVGVEWNPRLVLDRDRGSRFIPPDSSLQSHRNWPVWLSQVGCMSFWPQLRLCRCVLGVVLPHLDTAQGPTTQQASCLRNPSEHSHLEPQRNGLRSPKQQGKKEGGKAAANTEITKQISLWRTRITSTRHVWIFSSLHICNSFLKHNYTLSR